MSGENSIEQVEQLERLPPVQKQPLFQPALSILQEKLPAGHSRISGCQKDYDALKEKLAGQQGKVVWQVLALFLLVRRQLFNECLEHSLVCYEQTDE